MDKLDAKYGAAHKQQHILAIDDEPVILNSLKSIIGSDTYKFSGITSGAGALRYLGAHEAPDLILLDVEMPEMNGYTLIQELKKDPKTVDIPVIFLTSKSDDESELEGLTLGAVDYIKKPPPPQLLLKRIQVHLLVESQKHTLMAQQEELKNFNANLLSMVEDRTAMVVELKNAMLQTIAELVEFRDDITGGHLARTQAYLRVMLAEMTKQNVYEKEIADWDVNLILQSAQLHDVGKIAIPDNILKKPGKLTDAEFKEIKDHTLFGKDIIEKIQTNTTEQTFLEYARVFAISHHEKWDGSGYPSGSNGEEIPLLGRIMAIVDVYDALVSVRPYKKAFSHEETVNIIVESKGKHFDPVLVDVFTGVTGRFEEIAKLYRKNSDSDV